MTSDAVARRRSQVLTRGPEALQYLVLGIVVTSAIVEVVASVRDGAGAGAIVGILVTAAGVFAGLRWRWLGLAAVVVGPLLAALDGHEPVAAWSIACFAAFLFALRGMPGLAAGAVIGAGNLLVNALVSGTIRPTVDPVPSIAGVIALTMAAIGSSMRNRQKYWFELEQRTRDALATRQAAVDRAVAEERLRIARDLHDSVGHNIAVVNMHLGSAEVRLPEGAEHVREALVAARGGVQEVLRETQQILRVLRAGSGEESLLPTPGHGRIDQLVESVRAAGVEVEAILSGLEEDLPARISVATYRIVQEALTNAHRHGAGPVSLRVEVGAGRRVLIESANRCRAGDPPDHQGGGNGLAGIRERAASVGGTLEVRGEPPVFWIRAILPMTTTEEDA